MAQIGLINRYIFEYNNLGKKFIEEADKEGKDVRGEVLSFYPLIL